eukprot:CAMPEP_0117565920 /NCGR_PEP_ID=MMETSP0784-20121206/56824_1 /TAXON_ID=39447 /ORGANISM="" /LENGTH=361 /DNA_ID=CAMNT_0005363743 /DNA_START=56 /DNA_END=1141 /DNA_ORIENTATION=+
MAVVNGIRGHFSRDAACTLAPSSWTAVVRRVQAEEVEREAAVARLAKYVDQHVETLSARIEALREGLRPSAPVVAAQKAALGDQRWSTGSTAASLSSPLLERPEEQRIVRLEKDVEKLDNVMAEMLQAQLGALRMELGLKEGNTRPLRLEELRKALANLEERRRTRELFWHERIDAIGLDIEALQKAHASGCQAPDALRLAERVGCLEDRLCSAGKNSVEWELSGQGLTSCSRGQRVSSHAFCLAGVSGFKLHFYPRGHEKSEENRSALFLSGPKSEIVRRFSLFVDDWERDNTDDAIMARDTLAEEDGDDWVRGFYNTSSSKAGVSSVVVGIRLMDALCRDGGGLVHRFHAPVIAGMGGG